MTAPDLRSGGIAVLDFGSQYTQLIARRVRELGVYAEVFPFDAPLDTIQRHAPKGYILSGGPNSIYEDGAPQLQAEVLNAGAPILGLCYGMQALTYSLGGKVAGAAHREYGRADLTHHGSSLFEGVPDTSTVWMSHGDRIEQPPAGFTPLAVSTNSPYAAMGDESRGLYGVQFHPEVIHTAHGTQILRNYVLGICGCEPKWNTGAFIDDTIERIRQQVGEDGRVLLALSGGVDSSVAAALIQRAIGERLMSVFVNTGMMRLNEPEQVAGVFGTGEMHFTALNASEEFLSALVGVTDPESKRKIIGKTFIDIFTRFASEQAGAGVRFLGQGTIYPDVIESAHASKSSKVIKSHHNVGGLPADLAEKFALVEPLRDLFKDEVRRVGEALGLPPTLIWRQPFPGPGLGIRCPGEITWERLETLRQADAIFIEELEKAGLMRYDSGQLTAQCFVVLLPVKSVGVMGDNRTYEEVAALRAVATDDFMTADWARLDYALLARVSNRIVNEVKGINRVLYDITSKPPATIEWE
ncbi:MAG: glutamine-hydrolyzing GMP synthase [Anaerolineae bacterium]|nr:glutamine-hydrolyzing GMP synthase [Anaerolineae bacterium]